MPDFEVAPELFLRRVAGAGSEHRVGKGGEGLGGGPHGRDCIVQVLQETLKIDDGRSAVDPVVGAVDVDLPRVAGGAGHADRWPARIIGHGEADRKIGRRTEGIRQIAVSLEPVAQERLAIGLLEGLHPRQGHDPRTLVLGVERLPALGGPVGALVDNDDLRGGGDGDGDQTLPMQIHMLTVRAFR